MLKYFIDNCPNDLGKELFQLTNEIKLKLKEEDYEFCETDFQFPNNTLEQIKQIAKASNNEQLANSAFVFKNYFFLWTSLARFFHF